MDALSPLPRRSGIYLVTLTNTEPLSVNGDRIRIAERCIKVTSDNCKVGKAQDLAARARGYYKTFGSHHVRFEALAIVENPSIAENAILAKLAPYRIRGKTGRYNEWLENISADEVRATATDILLQFAQPELLAVAGINSKTITETQMITADTMDITEESDEDADPKDSKRYLEHNCEHGMGKQPFAIIHHFGDRANIKAHIRYLDKISTFQAGSKNIKVHRRLKHIFEAVRGRNRIEGDEFIQLAHEAVRRYPETG